MPPRLLSRFQLSYGISANPYTDPSGEVLILTEHVPYRYREFDDNRIHPISEGDNLWTLAERYFEGGHDNPSELYWVICDFQPDPIHDPTLDLEVGSTLVIPSLRTLLEEILVEKRREVA